MYKIAICDDDAAMLQRLTQHCKDKCREWQLEVQVIAFDNGDALLQEMEHMDYDAALLDIEMPGSSGLEVAKQIRRHNGRMAIVFVTSYEQMVFESIQYAIFRFIRKSRLEEELDDALAQLCRYMVKAQQYLVVDYDNRILKIPYSDILYLEKDGHNIKITYLCGNEAGVCLERAALKEYENKLLPAGFVKIHASRIVNMKYISGFDRNQLILDTGAALTIARDRIGEVKNLYFRYIRDIER